MTDTLTADCGHTYASSGIAAGYTRDMATGRTECYPCADNSQRAQLIAAHAAGEPFGAYLTPVANGAYRVTTWTGGTLMSVFRVGDGGRGFYGSGLWRVTAVDVHGNVWRGQGGGEGQNITMRPVRGGYVVGRLLGTDGSVPVHRVTLDRGADPILDVSRGASISWDLNNPRYRAHPHLFELTRSGRIVKAHRIPTA